MTIGPSDQGDTNHALLISEQRTALALSFVAGYVDVVGYLTLSGLYVSFMTGNTIRTGMSLGQGDISTFVQSGFPIVVYVLGVTIGSLLMRRKHGLRLALLFQIALIASFALISQTFVPHSQPREMPQLSLIVTAVLAMGIQNATIRTIHKESVSLGYITAKLSTIGVHLASWLDGSEKPSWGSISLPVLLWALFLTGAVVSGWIAANIGITVLMPVAIWSVLLVLDLRRPLLPGSS